MRYLNNKSIFKVLLVIVAHSLCFADERQFEKASLTPEQIEIDSKKIEEFKKNNSNLFSKDQFSLNDSIYNLLKFKDTLDSCLDRNCYVKKNQFNQFLNCCIVNSIENKDSIRTRIIFELLTKSYIRMQSNNLEIKENIQQDSCRNDSTDIYSYKVRMLAATDSLLLINTINSMTKKTLLFAKPVEIIFHGLTGENGITAELFFSLTKKYLDFGIQKSILDSAISNQWTTPIRSAFGFYTFYVIDKRVCNSEYNDLVENINSSRLSLNQAPECIDKKEQFVFNNTDTLIVKFWSKPAILSDSGMMIQVDTNKLSYTIIPDCKLPCYIRGLIREQYFDNGTTFFNNYKSDYCIWSLKIENNIPGIENRSKDISKNYLIAKRMFCNNEVKMVKRNEKIEAEKKNLFISELAEKNRDKVTSINDTLQAITQLYAITNQQIQKSTYEWIKKEISFIDNVFFEKYLPKAIIGY